MSRALGIGLTAAGVCVSLSFVRSAAAQPAVLLGRDAGRVEHSVSAATGLDGAVAASVGYAAGARLGRFPGASTGFLDVTLPFGDAELGDFRLRLGGELDVWRPRNLGVRARFAGTLTRVDTDASRAVGIGTEIGVLAGRFGDTWTLALEGRIASTWATHIRHTEWYRTYIFEGVRDGWYGATSETIRAGVRTGTRLGPAHLALSAGWEKSGAFTFSPPIYAAVGAGVVW